MKTFLLEIVKNHNMNYDNMLYCFTFYIQIKYGFLPIKKGRLEIP